MKNRISHKAPEEEGDSWLQSYADMVTLLLAFFVILVSISTLNMVKYELLTQHLSDKKDRVTLKDIEENIKEFVESENLTEEVKVSLTTKGVEISFKDKLLFDSGRADLKIKALDVLDKIGNMLNYQEIAERKISIEGHTDSVPIRSRIYPSNWELSTARASTVVRFFIDKGMERKRFESIGYADTCPEKRPDEQTVMSCPENRRVVVVVSPDSYKISRQRKEVNFS